MKKKLDPSILGSMNAAVSGSFADNIKMIDIDKIKPHEENFYSMQDIELLAEDIERQGLKENLVVRAEDDFFIVISGHRRREAVKQLIEQGRRSSRFVPCYINPVKSADEELQDLIMLNATTRVISDAETIQQYEKLKPIYEAKKANGEKFGRIREKIAEALGVSNGQAAKLENVSKNAIPEVRKAVEDGEMSINTADKLAKLSENEQSEKIKSKPAKEIQPRDFEETYEPEENVSLMTQNLSDFKEPYKSEKNVSLVTQNDKTEFQQACLGYAIEACREMGFDKQGIENFLELMEEKFYEFTAENAAMIYRNSI